jgi:putative thioredoxin
MQPTVQGASTPAPEPGALVKDADMTTFMADVIQMSQKTTVLVDFWAPWCGPCKQLTPVLEKLVKAANGSVRLVKVNIDLPQNQPLAQQLRIQSIPAVYAFRGGQPVDGFLGALPESQVKQFIERVAGGKVAESPVVEILAEAKAALEQGDIEGAAGAYAEAQSIEPSNPAALAGLARTSIQLGEIERAKEVLALVPAEHANHADVVGAKAALALAEEAQGATGDIANLVAKLELNPADHQTRFDLALALLGAGKREEAVDELLEIVRRNRAWNEEAARKQLLKLFEAFGPMDPLTVATRKRLSSLLFA